MIPLDWELGDHNFSPMSVPIHCTTLGKSLLSLGFPIWTLGRLDRSVSPKTHPLGCSVEQRILESKEFGESWVNTR